MIKLLYLSLGCTIVIAIAGCVTKDSDGREKAARALYERSVNIARLYTDSLRNALDSATVARLSDGLDTELTRLNYAFPPDTYLDVSEGENDTLASLSEQFVLLRDSLLYRFAHPLVLRQDSLDIGSTQS